MSFNWTPSQFDGPGGLSYKSVKMRDAWEAESGTSRHRRNKKCACIKISSAKANVSSFEEFAKYTSIHGFKYAFQRDVPLVERCAWMVCIVFCMIAAAMLVYTSVEKFYTNPTITAMRFMGTGTQKVPFPAVTFCNVNSIFRYKIKLLLKQLTIPEKMNLSLQQLERLLPIVGNLLLPDYELDDNLLHDFNLLEEVFDANNISIPVAARMLGQSCRDMVERCSWDGDLFDCNPVFLKRATFTGYCCSFNYDVATNWTEHPDSDPYKLRSYRFGPDSGLRVLLNPMERDYSWERFYSTGFSVAIHRPGVYPEGATIFVGPNTEARIRIYPIFAEGEEDLKKVQPDRRGCTFHNERKLVTSSSYSREECVLQCRATATLKLCGCVPFHYAYRAKSHKSEAHIYFKKLGHNTINFCNLRHTRCLKANFNGINSESTINKCDCWPQCKSLSYSLRFSSAHLDAAEHYVGDFYEGANTTGRSSINVFFAREKSDENKRALIYSVMELMSKMGGIFSLFLGCSFLTAMEFLYFSVTQIIMLISSHRPR